MSPICLFVYNRLEETQLTVEALKKNILAKESELYIFSDGAKSQNDAVKVNAVRDFLKTITGFGRIYLKESYNNKNLAESIISGVSTVFKDHDTAIIVEDDLVTLPNFLTFMNQALKYYRDEKRIQTVSGFSPLIKKLNTDVYFQHRPFPWGWGTWADRWDKKIFDKGSIRDTIDKNILIKFNRSCGNDISRMLLDSLNNKNNSWYVRWTYDHFTRGTYSLFPAYSFVRNIGFNRKGTHCYEINPYTYLLGDPSRSEYDFKPFEIPDNAITKSFLNYFTFKHKLNVRIKLLFTFHGMKIVIDDLLYKIKKLALIDIIVKKRQRFHF
ncbi:MAG: sugar transferase [Candidatus Omnitrophica bacterium]|nr:sugar transferase [Candidatus Omnitrophota bacterium]